MSVVISEEVLTAANMTPKELLVELAVLLFQQERLTLGQAAKLAGMNLYDFMRLLGSRKIGLHYDVEDLEADLRTLEDLGRL